MKSVLRATNTVNNNLVKKLKKSTYPKDWTFLSLYEKMKAAKN